MKKILQSSILLMGLFIAVNTQGQTLRYLDEVFSNVVVDTTIAYGANKSYLTGFAITDSLYMDVYRPAGDTSTNRPVVILMHAGSYLPGSLTGLGWANRRENCLVELCNRYAKRGWVAVSISYRLGWNPQGNQNTRTGTILNAVYRSMQDAKTCIRYFRNDAANGSDQWGIDPTKFVLGGTNSGAYTALAAGNLNKPSEIVVDKFLDSLGNSFIDTTKTGNFDGWGGTQNVENYVGISAEFNAVLPLGGAIGDTSWIEVGEAPVIAFSGVSDVGTPFNTGIVSTQAGTVPIIEVSGAGDFMPYVAALGNNSGFSPNSFAVADSNRSTNDGINFFRSAPVDGLYPFWGVGFEPWNWYDPFLPPASNPNATQTIAMAYIDTIMGYANPRLYRLLFDATYGNPSGLHEVKGAIEMNVFPSPASNKLNVIINSLQKPISSIRLLDVTGRLAKEITNVNAYSESIDVSNMSSGVYLLNLMLTDGTTSTKRVAID